MAVTFRKVAKIVALVALFSFLYDAIVFIVRLFHQDCSPSSPVPGTYFGMCAPTPYHALPFPFESGPSIPVFQADLVLFLASMLTLVIVLPVGRPIYAWFKGRVVKRRKREKEIMRQ